MNKLLLTSALVAALGAAALAPQTARAADGTITFNGTVTAATCTINTGTPDFAVTLLPVSTSTLAASGDTAGQKQFTIALSGCTGGTTASAFFEQNAGIDSTTGNLSNTVASTAGGAKNVEFQLLNSDGITPINLLDTTTNTTTADISGGSGALTYYVRYFATGASTAGTVKATEQYTISYQ